jgi:hypothetical protein
VSAAFRLHSDAALRFHGKPAGRVFAVTIIRPHPLAWQHALQLADSDTTRLRTQPDGSVIVSNHPRR